MTDFLDFIDLCEAQLKLSAVREGEHVAVVSRGDERLDYADAFMAAARRLGASTYQVRLPSGGAGGSLTALQVGATPLSGNPAAVEALKQSDLLIDLVFLLFSPEQMAIQATGTRILSVVEPVEVLRAMFPTPGQRERIDHGVELLRRASTLRVTSPAGTDVTYRLNTFPVVPEYGFNDRPGEWDHWPSGFLFTGGDEDGVDGTVVIAPGDIVFPFNDYVRTPITLTIEHGRIVDIRGELDALLLREYMASFGDPDAYGISHIGWGMHEKARRTSLAVDFKGIGMEARATYGNVLFSTGPNGELGGSNHTACHVDVPLHGCSLFLDEEPVIIDGDIVVPEMRAVR
ncbi:leucyl aminopeptidase [Streptosporangium algeriense]|uniref:Leucyl aminopeptidase n=1 Tax=Streptosporangium algeriense TaxID=1682748 RepID=A0ABW3DKM0_9ACTN